jgi:hypothetical protein
MWPRLAARSFGQTALCLYDMRVIKSQVTDLEQTDAASLSMPKVAPQALYERIKLWQMPVTNSPRPSATAGNDRGERVVMVSICLRERQWGA